MRNLLMIVMLILLVCQWVLPQPSSQPTNPTGQPSSQPSRLPSSSPSRQPSSQPSSQPTNPTGQPSSQPSRLPSSSPSRQPSSQPSSSPSRQPSSQPSLQPSSNPSSNPSMAPTSQPSTSPTSQPTFSNSTRNYTCGECGYTTNLKGINNVLCGFEPAITHFIPINGNCNYTNYSTFLVNGANITVLNKGQLYINTSNFTMDQGGIINADYVQVVANSQVDANSIFSINNGYIYSQSVQIFASTVSIYNGVVKGYDPSGSCINSTSSTGQLSCNAAKNGLLPKTYNSVVLNSSTFIQLNNGSLVGSLILACSQTVVVSKGGSMNTTALGCPSTSNCKGVGGSNCGVGGYSTGKCSGLYEECTNSASSIWAAGSGGNCQVSESNGGGIIVLYGSKSVVLNGIIESNGQSQYDNVNNCGGGAGGTVVVNTSSLSGTYGSILASGGNITDCDGDDGAGGGGFVLITNPANSTYSTPYNSTTNIYIDISGGGGASQTSCANSDGGPGDLWLPTCPIGSGNYNTYNVFQICQPCGLLFYQETTSSLPCNSCDEIYSQQGLVEGHFSPVIYKKGSRAVCLVTDDQCCYTCNQGYLGSSCISEFRYFLESNGGKAVIVLVALTLVACALYAVKYHVYDKKRKWLKTKEEDFITKVLYGTANFAVGPSSDDENNKLKEKLIVSPIHSDAAMSTVEKARYSPRQFLKGKISHRDIQLAWRLHDHDLPYHACRVTLIGSNELLDGRGGQWRLPPNRPVCLRPMLRKREYELFANSINATVAWNFFSFEALMLIVAFLINPFFSLYIQYVFKKRRAHKLLELVAEYNHECFRSYKQRENRNNIRIGISPDCSLAYLDFLCDKNETTPKRVPLCPVGQPALPVAVVFSGIGSFVSPYTVDSNDVLVQAICDNDLCTAFIDGSWINFIADLNKHLRTIQRLNLYDGIKVLLKFINDPKTLEPLGGLIINLCSFPNDVNSVPDEIDYPNEKRKTKIIDEKANGVENDSATDFNHRHSINTGNAEFVEKMKNFIDIGSNQNVEELNDTDRYTTWSPEKGGSNANRIFEDYDTHRGPQNRIDDNPTLKKEKKTRKYIDSIEKYLNGVANSAFSIIDAFYDVYENSNDIGSNYADLVSSVLKGQSKLGIMITHPKAVNNKIQFNNIDYINDSRSDYDTDPNVTRISSAISRESDRESKAFSISSKYSRQLTRFSSEVIHRDTELSVYNPGNILSLYLYLLIFININHPEENTREQDSKEAAQLYGDKAEEISKYYNIVFKAEGNLDGVDSNIEEAKKNFFSFRKKVEKVQAKNDVTYEQFMKRSFFTADNVTDDDIEATGIGIPQNIIHLKGILQNLRNKQVFVLTLISVGNVSKLLINQIVSLQYNNVLFLAPSSYQCPSAFIWEGNKLQELTCAPLNCFLSVATRSDSPLTIKDSPDTVKSRTNSKERSDSLADSNDHIISILHRPDVESNPSKDQVPSRTVSLSINDDVMLTPTISKSADGSRRSRRSHFNVVPSQPPCGLSVIYKFIIMPINTAALELFYALRYSVNYSFLGVNILPYGDVLLLLPVLRVLIFLTSIIEAVCFFFISTFYVHIWYSSSSANVGSNNIASSGASTSTGLIIVLSVPPLAILLNPILGFFTGMIGSSLTLAKAFAAFSRSASLSTTLVLIIYIIKRGNLCLAIDSTNTCSYINSTSKYHSLPCGLYITGLCINKAIQLLVADLYVSHVENFRLSRNWDGLSTSLTPTTDRQ